MGYINFLHEKNDVTGTFQFEADDKKNYYFDSILMVCIYVSSCLMISVLELIENLQGDIKLNLKDVSRKGFYFFLIAQYILCLGNTQPIFEGDWIISDET